MPEGDTIYRTAAVLRQALLGQAIQSASANADENAWPKAKARVSQSAAESLAGRTIERVEPRGKHLLIHLDNGAAVHSHMGMTGSWRLYEHGQPWCKPPRRAALQLETEQAIAVCFTPATLEVLSPDGLRRHRWLRLLGPDILDPEFDVGEAVERIKQRPSDPLGEVVMNQAVICGIGNIYKSEGLFCARLSPFDRVAECPDERLLKLVSETQRLMRRNLLGAPRRTRMGRDGASKWAYGRNGKPCLECGGLIQLKRQGELGRTTYWCPACQPAAGGQL